MREAWSIIEAMWADTTTCAQELPERKLHERVDEEWSFVEALRHLVFVTDSVDQPAGPRCEDHYHHSGCSTPAVRDACALGIDRARTRASMR